MHPLCETGSAAYGCLCLTAVSHSTDCKPCKWADIDVNWSDTYINWSSWVFVQYQKNENLKSSTLVSSECAVSVYSGHVSGVHFKQRHPGDILTKVSDLSQEQVEGNSEIIRSEIKKNTKSLFQR